jgi:hypothetical protein
MATEKGNCKISGVRVFEEEYSSEWASINKLFVTPKKNETIRVVTGFRKLNLLLNKVCHPFPIPKR